MKRTRRGCIEGEFIPAGRLGRAVMRRSFTGTVFCRGFWPVVRSACLEPVFRQAARSRRRSAAPWIALGRRRPCGRSTGPAVFAGHSAALNADSCPLGTHGNRAPAVRLSETRRRWAAFQAVSRQAFRPQFWFQLVAAIFGGRTGRAPGDCRRRAEATRIAKLNEEAKTNGTACFFSSSILNS